MPNIYDKYNNLHIIRDEQDIIDIVKDRIGYEFGQELDSMFAQAQDNKGLEDQVFDLEQEINAMENTIDNSIRDIEKILAHIEETEDGEIELGNLIIKLNKVVDRLERY